MTEETKTITTSIYVKEADVPAVQRAIDCHGGPSSALVNMAKELFPEKTGDGLDITIRYTYSEKWRQEQAMAGKTAPYHSTIEFRGELPAELVEYAKIEPDSVMVDMTGIGSCAVKLGVDEVHHNFGNDNIKYQKWDTVRGNAIEFDYVPLLPDICAALPENLTPEQKKQNEKWCDEADAKKKEMDTKDKEAEAQQEKEKRKEKEKEENEYKKGENNLKDWAMKNGSELLKARIEEGLYWRGLAEEEFVNVHIAECPIAIAKELDKDSSAKSCEEPSLSKIKALKQLREWLKVNYPHQCHSTLMTVTYFEEYNDNDNDNDQVQVQTEIKVVLTTPCCSQVRFFLAE